MTIMMDLSKAFDTLKNQILLVKNCKPLILTKKIAVFIENYFTNRQQRQDLIRRRVGKLDKILKLER